jgi:hypothetical protein
MVSSLAARAVSHLSGVQPKEWIKYAVWVSAAYTIGMFTFHMLAATKPSPAAATATTAGGRLRRGQLPAGMVMFVPTLVWQPVSAASIWYPPTCTCVCLLCRRPLHTHTRTRTRTHTRVHTHTHGYARTHARTHRLTDTTTTCACCAGT